MNGLRTILIAATVLSCSTTTVTEPSGSELSNARTRVANGVRTTVHPPEVRSAVSNSSAREPLPAQLTFIVERDWAPRDEAQTVITEASTPQRNRPRIRGAFDVWKGHVKLICGDSTYRPVLSHVERTHGLTQEGKFILVFAPTSLNDTLFGRTPVLDLVLDDRGTHSGIQHYRFKHHELRHI